jgi:hypothetical protein
MYDLHENELKWLCFHVKLSKKKPGYMPMREPYSRSDKLIEVKVWEEEMKKVYEGLVEVSFEYELE